MANITNIPAPRVPFIDERTKLMSREWYRFFLNLFVLTGSGTTDVTVADLAVSPVAPVDNSEDVSQATQLAALTAQYDAATAAIQGAYLQPVAVAPNPVYWLDPAQNVGTLAYQNADNVNVGTLNAATYSVGGTAGASGTGTVLTALTVVNGLVTAITIA